MNKYRTRLRKILPAPALLSLPLLLLSLLYGCGASPEKPISKTTTLLDTIVRIDIYEKGSEDILDECIQKCADYERRFSRTQEGSEIYRLNHAGGAPVELSNDTIQLIRLGLKYCELTDGAFDITMGNLSDLWDFKNNPGQIPDTSQITETVKHIGYQNVVMDGNTVRLMDPEISVDLGGIAKGYIADRLRDYLEESGVRCALIDLGGNILAVGNKPDGAPFNIGIQKPFDELGSAIASVKADDCSVVSSGIYQRYFEVDGILYHHILDPTSGYPYENGLLGVTIVCDSSADADALSTSCFALGLPAGMELIEKTPGTEALFITDDYELHYSSGFDQ
ncbi:MAG: FAD:protein FMN transferase [Coprococcus sp.]|nr:FAD:protein FMN transferase [Coprococcus sp.]